MTPKPPGMFKQPQARREELPSLVEAALVLALLAAALVAAAGALGDQVSSPFAGAGSALTGTAADQDSGRPK